MSILIKMRTGALSSCTKEMGLSRDALSRRMGVASSTAWRVDRGDVAPSTKFIAALIRVSGKSFEDLFEIVADDEQVPA